MRLVPLTLLAAAIFAAGSIEALAAADPLRSRQYGLEIVEADAAHRVTTGAGALVAVIDTGVLASHEDLRGPRLLPGHDFVQDDATPQDGDGHGTHVLGIVGASAGNGVGVSSVAPGASMLPVRVLGNDGGGSTDDVARGIDYAVSQGAHVLNLSLGDTLPVGTVAGRPQDIDAALDRALDRGLVVVASAGNNGFPVCEQPSAGGRLLCVGAVDRSRMRAGYSSFPGEQGVMAPGGAGLPLASEDILSTFNDGRYTEIAGTSQAAPHVAGVAALLVERGLRGQDVVRRIRATASDAGPPGPDAEYGAGIVNARAAVSGLPAPPRRGQIAVRADQRASYLRRKGLRIRCVPPEAGRCVARVSAARRVIATGSARTGAGRAVTVVARLTREGRRLLARTRRVRALVQVSLPGSPTLSRRITIRR